METESGKCLIRGWCFERWN